MSKTDGGRSYRAEIQTACSCDWGCPCNFNAPPTRGFCEGGWALRITNGRCGTVSLDGLAFALMARWPRAIHEGGGTAKAFIDERATEDQRQALDRIVTGKLGGKPWPIFAPTIDTWLETSFVPVEWQFDGVRSRYKFGEEVRLTMAPMRNPVRGGGAPAKTGLPGGLASRGLNKAASPSYSVFAPAIQDSWPGTVAWHRRTAHGP